MSDPLYIYIPTRGRPGNQRTLMELPEVLRKRTTLVIDSDEVQSHSAWGKYCDAACIMPAELKGIAAKRQFILELGQHRKIVMLDDDLDFAIRNNEGKQLKASPAQIEDMFNLLDAWLDEGIVHCSLTLRFLNWSVRGIPWIENSRMIHVLAYDCSKVLAAGAAFTKGVDHRFSMEDFHMTLQLLAAGYKNRISLQNVSSPGKSNAPGGVSAWRTTETQNYSAERLQELHPRFVKVKTKQAWKGLQEATRKDVVVQWRKAFLSSGRSL